MEACFFVFNPKSKKRDIDRFEKFIKHSLPDDILMFFQKTGGYTIKWRYQSQINHEYILGCSFVRSLDSYVHGQRMRSSRAAKKGERHKEFLWSVGDDPALIKYLEDNYFILDQIDFISDTSVIFKFEEGKEEPLLFLYTYPHYMYPLKLTFIEYIELSIHVRGMSCWQEYFIDKEKTDPEALKQLEKQRSYDFFDKMKQVFPESDLSKFPDQEMQVKQSYLSLAQTKNYHQRFKDKISMIENKIHASKGCFKITYINDPLSIWTIRKVETILGRRLPDSMLAFYSQMKGFNLRWSYEDPSLYKENSHSFPGASFKLLSLGEVFGGFEPHKIRNWHDRMFEGIVTMEGVMDDDELVFASQCRLIYSCEFNDTVIRFVDGKEEPELYLIIAGHFLPLQLSFEDFIERLIENLGMEYWQRFFTKPKDYSDDDLSTCPPVPLFIKDVFPDVDILGYRQVESNIKIDRP